MPDHHLSPDSERCVERGALGLVNYVRDRHSLPPLMSLDDLASPERWEYVAQARAVLDAASTEENRDA